MIKSLAFRIVSSVLVITCMMGCNLCADTQKTQSPCGEGMPCFSNTSAKGLNISIAQRTASLKKGIDVRIIIRNNGKNPHILNVCPAMTLCCVKGLHPMIEYDNTGMSLLDVCKSEKPKKYQSFLPVGACMSFDVTIPPKCLPAECKEPGKQFKLKFYYEREDIKQVDSNELMITLK